MSPPVTSGNKPVPAPQGPGTEGDPEDPQGQLPVSLPPLREEKGGPPPPRLPLPAHGDDVGSLLSGWSLLEDFGFSKMNLLRRSVSELAWAHAYASPGDKAEGGLTWGCAAGLEGRQLLREPRNTHRHSWRTQPCSGSQ